MTRPPMPGSVIIIKFDCAIFSQQNSGLDSGDPIKIKKLDPENFWVQISELQNKVYFYSWDFYYQRSHPEIFRVSNE